MPSREVGGLRLGARMFACSLAFDHAAARRRESQRGMTDEHEGQLHADIMDVERRTATTRP